MTKSFLGFDFFIWCLTGAGVMAVALFGYTSEGWGLYSKVFTCLFTIWTLFIVFLIIQKQRERYQRRDYVPSWGLTHRFTVGMKALSNNLPALTEAIKKYRELEAQGNI